MFLLDPRRGNPVSTSTGNGLGGKSPHVPRAMQVIDTLPWRSRSISCTIRSTISVNLRLVVSLGESIYIAKANQVLVFNKQHYKLGHWRRFVKAREGSTRIYRLQLASDEDAIRITWIFIR